MTNLKLPRYCIYVLYKIRNIIWIFLYVYVYENLQGIYECVIERMCKMYLCKIFM
jgi:hypothetical protein